tara:strand:+ start:4560 stop:5309 length:750 start_codon:yes stop_codon:yes gene_type:complete
MEPKTKQFIVIANMKMNVIQDSYLQHYKNLSLASENYITVLMPPNPFVITLHNILGKDNVKYLGSQSIFSEKEGSYTGGTSIDMIKNYISYVLVGHSERRIFFAENNTDIQKQIKLVLDSNLIPILAVGESSEDKNNNKFQSVIREQLSILNDIQASNPIYIAYEPIWAIGTGDVADSKYIEDAAVFILNEVKTINPSLDVSLIYGGSVTENNIMDICNISNVNGVLVGGASADISKFSNILQKIKEAN